MKLTIPVLAIALSLCSACAASIRTLASQRTLDGKPITPVVVAPPPQLPVQSVPVQPVPVQPVVTPEFVYRIVADLDTMATELDRASVERLKLAGMFSDNPESYAGLTGEARSYADAAQRARILRDQIVSGLASLPTK